MLEASFHDMFTLGLPIIEKIARPILVYIFLLILLRAFGKRELAQLNPFDLVVLLSLSNTVQNAIIGDDNSVTGGIIGAIALVGVNAVIVRLVHRHHTIENIVEGEATSLISDGKINQKALESELLTETELLSVINRQGFANFDDIEDCTLEPNGTFAIIPKKPSDIDIMRREFLDGMNDIKAEIALLRDQKKMSS